VEREAKVSIRHESDIVAARREGRAIGQHLGFTSGELTVIATAISEIARNIVVYAKAGEIHLGIETVNGKKALMVIARDQGPGIANIERAMMDGYSSAGGLGLGLPGAKRLMDEFHIQSEVGKGTTITMKKWARSSGA
jgi:serine/threonine-protein kinase RsbT